MRPFEGDVVPIDQLLQPKEQRKLLALDGGGIRGLITVEVLGEIEDQLRGDRGKQLPARRRVRLRRRDQHRRNHRDLRLARDERRRDPRVLPHSGEAMFDKASLLRRFRTKFEDDRLAAKLKEVIGEDTTLGSDKLRTLLLIVMRNATTDSPWPLSNNPHAKYNLDQRRRGQGKACNLDLPLWQLVRASTAAPTYFPPEAIDAGGPGPFLMVDGGVTMYNNPAFLVFLMATVEPYNLRWPAGTDQMLRRVDRHRHQPEGQPGPRARAT